MEFTEAAVREFLINLVSEALAADKPDMDLRFAQKRFVKGDPALVHCTWALEGGRRSQTFVVAFSGESVANFASADDERRARLRAAAIAAIRERHRAFDPADTGPYPLLCQIDYLGK